MRIDKFLWSLRYFKTRNMAGIACKKGQVRINNQSAKPARVVYPADQITLRKNQMEYQLTVLDIPKNRVGAKLVDLYRKDTTPKEALENQALVKLAQDQHRKKGLGRPTKKDRRDMEDYLSDEQFKTSEKAD